jgi:hypothetical protein
MGARTVRTTVVVAVGIMALAGCQGEEEKVTTTAATPSSSPSASASAKSYTAKELKGALIDPPAGAEQVRTGSGSYTKVLKKLSEGIGSDDTTDEPACGELTSGDLKQMQSMPTAFVDFAQIERSSSVLLLADPSSLGKKAVTDPVPQACRSVKSRVGGTTITSKVVSDESFDFADGGRISRTDQTDGTLRLRVWEATFAGPGYVAMCSVVGEHVTRADVERLARQEYGKASATLK